MIIKSFYDKVTLYSWQQIILNHFLNVFIVTGGNQVSSQDVVELICLI